MTQITQSNAMKDIHSEFAKYLRQYDASLLNQNGF